MDGAHRKMLMREPRNGFFQVPDRQTGKLIFRGQRGVSAADAPVDTLLRVEVNGQRRTGSAPDSVGADLEPRSERVRGVGGRETRSSRVSDG